MYLLDSFSLTQAKGKYISLVGAGGKSTLLYQLAHELCLEGHKCVVMTSTHIDYPSIDLALTITDNLVNPAEALRSALNGRNPVAIGTVEVHSGKLCMPSDNLLKVALAQADWIIVEADGSRKLPLKVPASHEPVILEPSEKIIAVAGLSALGKPLSQVCHRAILASKILNVSIDALVTPAMMARLLTSEQGQFKGVLDPSRFTIFLNQADEESLYRSAMEIAKDITEFLPGCAIVIGSLQKKFVRRL